MFITFVFIDKFDRKDRELIVCRSDDAYAIATVIDKSEEIIAWNMKDHKLRDFGWAKAWWSKYKEVFESEDFVH